MTLTDKQQQLFSMLWNYKYSLPYGGARSGKTVGIVAFIIFLAEHFPESRHLIARRYLTDIRASIFKQTIPFVLKELGLERGDDYDSNEQNGEYRFANGSTIICAGLDDKERVDKVLGQEYATIYINESTDVPYATLKTLRTRLSQKVKACASESVCENRLICDLNPQSIQHWTYKLWFEGIDPETLQPIINKDKYCAMQLNPYDNVANLPQSYITEELETLTGAARERFLLGQYQTQDDIRVFKTPETYTQADFMNFCKDRWDKVRLVGGLDLGYQDADAFCILAYFDDCRDVFLLYEFKERREELESLIQGIRTGIDFAYSFPLWAKDITIYCDTATLRYGHEGDRKKSASVLASLGLPVTGAYKRDKKLSIDMLISDVNVGNLRVLAKGPFYEETLSTVWTKQSDGVIIRIIDDSIFHPDMMDAIRYGYEFIRSYGSEAYRHEYEMLKGR